MWVTECKACSLTSRACSFPELITLLGQVQISEATYELLKHKYLRKLFEARVVPELKGIGTLLVCASSLPK